MAVMHMYTHTQKKKSGFCTMLRCIEGAKIFLFFVNNSVNRHKNQQIFRLSLKTLPQG